MNPVQALLALVLTVALSCRLAAPVQATTIEDSASRDLIATLEKARDVREQAEIKLRDNLKLMAASCAYMDESLKDLMTLENEFEDRQIADFSTGVPDAYELELLDQESREIKELFKRSHCDDPLIQSEQA